MAQRSGGSGAQGKWGLALSSGPFRLVRNGGVTTSGSAKATRIYTFDKDSLYPDKQGLIVALQAGVVHPGVSVRALRVTWQGRASTLNP
jgi:hypothetical protein